MLRVAAFLLDAPFPRFLEGTGNRRGSPKASEERSHSSDYAAMYHSNYTAPVRPGVNWTSSRGAPTARGLPLHLPPGQTHIRIE